MRPRRCIAALAVGTLVCSTAALLAPSAGLAEHTEPPARVTLMGSLMNELGCDGDWDESCTRTDLTADEEALWTFVATVPAGAYELKVRLNGSWDENYGAGGVAGGPNIPLVLLEQAELRFTYDHATHKIGIAPATLPPGLVPADAALARSSLREDLTRERFYFVMADRFENGDVANDSGGLASGRLQTGLDPTHKGFYHGGDLRGIIERLDYIEGMGTTAIWLTPSFKNKPVQGTAGQESAGYHGYWITDFTQIDPHLGTNAELEELIDLAHARGMKVFFDIITNHTADVLDYESEAYAGGGSVLYRNKTDYPYRDADGEPFDDRAYALGNTFPAIDEDSFPYRTFPKPGEENVKVPAWLNDPTMYHNRGTSSFAGEDAEYGDFPGGYRQALDDLWTERPEVVNGMIDIYRRWVEQAGVDGFRIDTVKHVNMEFWQRFSPALQQAAADAGNDDFFMFGEVFDANPEFMSRYTTAGRLQATVDFGYQANAAGFAMGLPGTDWLRDLFAGDDLYTDADSNAYSLPTFLGNHDMGRIGLFLRSAGHSGSALLERDLLAHSLMYLTRGQPVVYYGDEQGFTGDGGDQDAREDMFASQVASYNDNDLIGTTATTATPNFDTSHPIYRHLAELSALRDAHPALADGAQVHRYATTGQGIYAFSRVDAKEKIEYVIAANNADATRTAQLDTFSPRQVLQQVWPAPTSPRGASKAVGLSKLKTDDEGRVAVTVPARSAVVYRATAPVQDDRAEPAPFFQSVSAGDTVGGRAEISVGLPGDGFREATFAWRPAGSDADWTVLGTDDNAPYRVFHDVSGMQTGTLLEYRAVARDADGDLGVTSTYAVVGDPPPPGGGGGPVGPVNQPQAVAIPGSHGSELGCPDSDKDGGTDPGDWDPTCEQAQLGLDLNDGIWKSAVAPTAGGYAFKAAIDRSWNENYGVGGVPGGADIGYTTAGGPVTFYYDHRTHWVTNDLLSDIVTVAGSFQQEIGCSADWDPACMRAWLQDPDDNGVYTLSTTEVPAGSWEAKATVDGNWTSGPNTVFEVPGEGWVTTFSWDSASGVFSVGVSEPVGSEPTGPDLSTSRATWVDRDLIAWDLPADIRGWTFRLHYGPAGSLSVDAESLGGSSLPLMPDPAGLPASVVAAHPELAGDDALRLSKKDARQAEAVATSDEVAVAAYDGSGRLVDATAVTVADWSE